LRLSVQISENAEKTVLNKSKMKKLDIAAEKLPEIVEEDDISFLVDNAALPPEQNLTLVIE
jgi:hypothetical protein